LKGVLLVIFFLLSLSRFKARIMVRPKVRYILFELTWGAKKIDYDSKKVLQAIKESIHANYGDFGLSCVQIYLAGTFSFFNSLPQQ
jgi:RNase P/RNase MRP subunit POP5